MATAAHLSFPERMNLTTFLLDDHLAAGRGDQVAICHPGGTVSYRELAERVARAGHLLKHLGVFPEQRVLLLLPDSPEFVAAFLGAIRIGAVAVPANTLLSPREIEYLLNDSRATALVVHAGFYERIRPILPNCPYLRQVVLVGGSAGGTPGGSAGGTPGGSAEGAADWGALMAAQSPTLAPMLCSQDDPAFWLYTSGTTGFPKAAVHLQHDALCSEPYAVEILGIGARDRTFAASKLFFAYGLGNNLLIPLRWGASMTVLPDKPTPANVAETIQRFRPSVFFGVPSLYSALLADPELAPDTFAGVRYCVSAGEALPAELYRRFRARFGVEMLDGMGTTEVVFMMLSNRPGRVRPGSSGEVVPGTEVRLVDDAGQEALPNQPGHLLVKTESACAYYWNQHQKTKLTIQGEWLRTGDVYIRDDQGYYFYQGRSDDMFKSAGAWISPMEVESALLEHPAVMECAVVAYRDEQDMLRPKAFVRLNAGHAGSPALAAELQEFTKGRIARYKYPRAIEFVAELPRTATGKVKRYLLRTGQAAT